MKSTDKKTVDAKAASKAKQRQAKKSITPTIERDHSFSDHLQERQTKPIAVDHEPGIR